jgi:hypothetical protein
MVRSVEFNAAAHFLGYTDEWPDAEMTESLQRARGVLAVGLAHLAIEKARNRGCPGYDPVNLRPGCRFLQLKAPVVDCFNVQHA